MNVDQTRVIDRATILLRRGNGNAVTAANYLYNNREVLDDLQQVQVKQLLDHVAQYTDQTIKEKLLEIM